MHKLNEQNEQIIFANGISTLKARGQVEKWLHELEKNMKESISNEIQRTLAARTEQSLVEWIEQWPGQCVMNGNKFSVCKFFDSFTTFITIDSYEYLALVE